MMPHGRALNSLGLSVMHFTVPICNDVYLLTCIVHESASGFACLSIDDA